MMADNLQAHFVTFYSPGTFVAEMTTRPIERWSPELASEMMVKIHERYGAVPYGFRFTTRARGPDDLDSKETDASPMYYVGGKVETLAEIEARDCPEEGILRSNMRCNGYERVWTTTKGWRWTQPLRADDIVLQEEPTP